MHPLAALALVAAGWIVVRPRPRCRPVTFADVEVVIFTRGATVLADGRPGLRITGPVADIEGTRKVAAEAFEVQLRAALMAESHRA